MMEILERWRAEAARLLMSSKSTPSQRQLAMRFLSQHPGAGA
jgi:hypothetical protein